ncbi:MAG: 50S ribosomal protein L25 [Myxococcales bacterium]|jgi:large subunit ribosomal protein L25|nr:MAG: 50S ribosomal protein L25 [Myxococcales bacterium]
MQRIEIEVSRREPNTNARVLRRGGRLPGVFYGVGGGNVHVHVEAHAFNKLGLARTGAHLIRFSSEDSALSGGVALIKQVQTHPVSGAPVHVDFLRVDLNKPVDANVALNFTGKAAGIIEGGILQPLRREVHVRALPDRLPESIEVDVTSLAIHDSLHIADVTMPAGVEIVFTENYAVVTVVPPVVEVEEATADAAEAAPAAAAGGGSGEGAEEKKDD